MSNRYFISVNCLDKVVADLGKKISFIYMNSDTFCRLKDGGSDLSKYAKVIVINNKITSDDIMVEE